MVTSNKNTYAFEETYKAQELIQRTSFNTLVKVHKCKSCGIMLNDNKNTCGSPSCKEKYFKKKYRGL